MAVSRGFDWTGSGKRLGRWLGAAALCAGLAVGAAPDDAHADWQPKRPIEFVIMAGTGGGADQIARLFQSIIEEEDFSRVPVIPINKPGGSGAEALRYLQDEAGNEHVMMITLNSLFTTPQLNPGLGVDIETYTPIARMALDTFQLWVHADSGIENLDDYIAAVKDADGSWQMGGTGKGQEDSLVTAMLEQKFGLEMTYIPFPGGGTVAKNLVGKHIDSTVNNPAEQIAFYEAGRTRPLMTMTPQRLDMLPDVPTSKELGHPDLVYYMQRSIVAAPEISEEARQWYTELMRKVYESEQWKAYTASEGLFREWLEGDELAAYFADEVKKHKQLLAATGEM
jgi:tripartite-type tricarboxylate transporter receptor subunit TctC